MTVQDKREKLALQDAGNWDYETICNVALDGCPGYNNMTDVEVNELYANLIGKGRYNE